MLLQHFGNHKNPTNMPGTKGISKPGGIGSNWCWINTGQSCMPKRRQNKAMGEGASLAQAAQKILGSFSLYLHLPQAYVIMDI